MPPEVVAIPPRDIEAINAEAQAIMVDTGGETWSCTLVYHRSDKKYWENAATWWNIDTPQYLRCDVPTKWPMYQHEYKLQCMSVFPFPPHSIESNEVKYWYIPWSLYAKGAPFLVTAAAISAELLNITLTLTTDIGCHMTAMISTVAPFSTAEVETKRGRKTKHHPVLRWQWQWEKQQDEPGDTIQHTINWTAPFTDTTFYIQCYAHTDTKKSPSRTPFYSITITAPIPPTVKCQSNVPPFGYSGSDRCMWWSSCFMPHAPYRMTSCDIYYKNFGNPDLVCSDGRFELWTADAAGRPTILLQTVYFVNPDLTPNKEIILNIPITPLILNAGSGYAIAWGWFDYWPRPREKHALWAMCSSTTCEYTIPPERHIYLKRYDSGYHGRCTDLLQDWYQYSHDHHLGYKILGQGEP